MAYGTLRADLIENTNGLTGNAIGPGFKNRIINGDMRIAQRGTSSSSVTTGGYYTVDRWFLSDSMDATYTISQETDAPSGFVNSTKILVTTADSSIGATQYAGWAQNIEGFNVADLGWGSAGAKTITISFWVKSSLTGTFGGYLTNQAGNRWYPFSYSISSANTWEQKTVTIAGDTSGTWLKNNDIGIEVFFSLGVGSTYAGTAGSWTGTQARGVSGQVQVVGTSNATWFITGVQFEVGPSATSFDYRPYTTELQLCQRYFISYGGQAAYEVVGTTGIGYSTTYAFSIVVPPVEMRATPTLTTTGTFNWSDYAVGNSTGALSISAGETSTKHIFIFSNGTASGITQYRPYMLIAANSTASRIGLSAEL